MLGMIRTAFYAIKGAIYGIWGYMIASFLILVNKENKKINQKYEEKGYVLFDEEVLNVATRWMGIEIIILNLSFLVVLLGSWPFGNIALLGVIPITIFTIFSVTNRMNYAYQFLVNHGFDKDVGYDKEFLDKIGANTLLKYEHLVVDSGW